MTTIESSPRTFWNRRERTFKAVRVNGRLVPVQSEAIEIRRLIVGNAAATPRHTVADVRAALGI